MIILDGKKIKTQVLDELHNEVSKLENKPSLVVIEVGNNEASNIYIKQKAKMAESIGYDFKLLKFPEDINESDLLFTIDSLNNDTKVNAILVQLPLPKHLNASLILNSINPNKDVDGLSRINAGALLQNEDCLIPCTPLGIMHLLREYHLEVTGKNVTIIGRSNLVGKPIAILLSNAGATVTLCHSKTKNLKAHTLMADIIIVAVGHPNLITEDMVKENTIVIDVGINKVDNHICGDVDFESIKNKASYITPVPGGVGPMTVAMLGANVLKAYKIQKDKSNG